MRSRSLDSKPCSGIPVPADGTRLQLPPGEADIEALRSVTREWLVPRLVEKFLRAHGIELKHSRQHADRLRLSLSGGLSLAGDEAGPRTSIGGTGDLSKKLDRRRMRKRNTEC